MESKAKYIADILKTMSNEHRLLLLCALLEEDLTVSMLTAKTPDITQSAVSQHLSVLRDGGLIDSSKSGREVTYFIKDKRIVSLIATLKDNFC